ncbi:MAG: gliding motility-associated ABC transporter permease subunit GldF [Chitinophagales bacterium]|nr:MAG: gliding motility-associated ABC transporter permease subunit GldF [Chitinophagales bacterium]
MIAVYLKEINAFFSSLTGYLVLSVFLLLTGLFVWIFPDTSVLNYGFATLEGLFMTAPWVFMFLIPAITMRSFSEELQSGTYELLSTRPLTETAIIAGKYMAALTLILFALLPTLIYFFSVYRLGSPPGNIDTGGSLGSYLGLLLLGAAFAAIGIFSSAVTRNQIVAFLLAVFLCFFFFMAFDFLSRLDIFYAKTDDLIETLGIYAHYNSVSRGVVDTRDLLYFFSLDIFFLWLTYLVLQSRKWT